jgi:hypothetical protein
MNNKQILAKIHAAETENNTEKREQLEIELGNIFDNICAMRRFQIALLYHKTSSMDVIECLANFGFNTHAFET